MSKILVVCLVLFVASAVYGQAQIRLINAEFYTSVSIAITPDVELIGNTTVTGGLASTFSDAIPTSSYMDIPLYEFTVGEELTLYAFRADDIFTPVNVLAQVNATFVDKQSYSIVYVSETEDVGSGEAYSSPVPGTLLVFEERPNPSPIGKALVRVVNIAVSTLNPSSNMTVVINGTGEAREFSLAFGEASDFLEFDTAGALQLFATLPTEDGPMDRIVSFNTVIDSTTVIYLRGDLGASMRQGKRVDTVEFTFPAAPTAPVAAPTAPTAAPTDAPAAPTAPTAPVAAPAGTPTRAPTRRVSSAATTVAQIAGVAVVMSLIF